MPSLCFIRHMLLVWPPYPLPLFSSVLLLMTSTTQNLVLRFWVQLSFPPIRSPLRINQLIVSNIIYIFPTLTNSQSLSVTSNCICDCSPGSLHPTLLAPGCTCAPPALTAFMSLNGLYLFSLAKSSNLSMIFTFHYPLHPIYWSSSKILLEISTYLICGLLPLIPLILHVFEAHLYCRCISNSSFLVCKYTTFIEPFS